MRYSLLKSVASLLLAFGASASATAQTTVYGIKSNWDGNSTVKFDIESLSTESKTTPESVKEINYNFEDGIICGANVGDKYYAFLYDVNYKYSFATINHSTGEVTIINNQSYKNGAPGANMQGMAYNEATGVLYGISQDWDETDSYQLTNLYSIDPSNGVLTLVTTYEQKFSAMAYDGNGGMYLLENKYKSNFQPLNNIYAMDSTFGIELLIDGAELDGSSTSPVSLLTSQDGNTLYKFSASTVYAYNLTDKTVSKLGTLSNSLYGPTFTMSTALGEVGDVPQGPKQRYLVSKTWYGDAMGTVPSDKDMQMEYYFYNYDDKLAFTDRMGREYDTDLYKISYYTSNNYDGNGKILSSTQYQYGSYDFGDWAREKRSETVYTYDEAGNLIQEDMTTYTAWGESTNTNTYTYDEDGNVATKVIKTPYDEVTETYSSYIAPGCPEVMVSTGKYDGDNYTAYYIYDNNGNKIQEDHTVMVEDEMFGEMLPKAIQVELWEYDDDSNPLSYIRYKFNEEGQPYGEFKIDYAFIDEAHDRIQAKEYTSFDGEEWYSQSTYYELQYADFTDKMEDTYIDLLAQPAEEGVNNVELMFSVWNAVDNDPKAVIYRDGDPIATINIMDYIDTEGWFPVVKYVDEGVQNGEHEYFVQPLVESEDNAGYYVSYPAAISLNYELPAVTDVKLAGARKETEGTFGNMTETVYGTISWTNPEYDEECGFISNDLMINNAQMSDITTTDPNANQLESEFYFDSKVYILSRFKYGKAISDTIEVKMADLNDLITSAINGVVNAGELQFNIANKVVTLSNKANIAVYGADGKMAVNGKNTDTLDMSRLSNGTYIICVENNGKTNAYKVTLK